MEIIRGLLWRGFKVVVTFALLYLALKGVDYNSIVATIRGSSIYLLLISYLIAVLMPLINSLRIKILTDEHDMTLTLWNIANINYVSLFYSLVIPSSLTVSAVRYYRLSRTENKYAEIISSLSYLKILSVFVILSIAIVFFDKNLLHEYHREVGIILITLYMLLILLMYMLLTSNGFRLFSRMIMLLHYFRLPDIAKSYAGRFLDSAKLLNSLSWRKLCNLLFLTVLFYSAGILSFILLAHSVYILVDTKSLISIRSLSLIITSIPVSVAGFGLREGSFIVLFKSFAIEQGRIISLSFLLFGRTLLFAMIGGFIELVNLMKRSDKLTQDSTIR